MSPSQYGHSTNGVNIANFRIINQKKECVQPGQYRSPFDWQQETAKTMEMGNAENLMSSTLRHSSNLLQTAAVDLVVSDVKTVEQALRTKIRQTDQLKNALESALNDTLAERDLCIQIKSSLEQRLARVQEKQGINESRLQVRNGRPLREKTMDDVEGLLLKQQGFVSAFYEKVKRAINHVDRELAQLDMVRQRLEGDLQDKTEAIDVDSKVLGILPDGTLGEAGSLRRRADTKLKTPHTWVTSTEDNIKLARHWITDSIRLRKAVRTSILNSRSTEHEISRTLNYQMMSKLGATQGLRDHLQRELERVRTEGAKAESQRSSLAHALESKRGPLMQAKERFAARKARPERELVADDVEAALAREIAHLNAVTSQLSHKLGAVDKEINSLDLAAMTLEDNIRDKEAALSVDEQVVMLDGRINLTSPPPSSVGSNTSNLSAAREATLRRIQDLEGDLISARREREALEANVAHLKATMSSPKGHLGGPDPFGA
ncbi:hypothetical protein CEUSTIGMA_g1599.t1 [Chlamydomonas eustigma]|uniref:Tektin n=1 Tax=Chlamydomonas eustigma TaxID=1157962 RepID=A0A250WUB8_9CHLO|nr:hypothetical protein CEUSTIGMA_g1599.t1 [Chlamydomonas eustigma]|eukprot:GAX74150.1 hypothetical protein CEUSTIGMA_g1599.t1 [Chlamydomonas eustigma]